MASPTIAVVPSRAVTASVQPVAFRVILYSVGTLLLAVGIALNLVAGLGVGPSDVFIGAVAEHVGIGHGTATSGFIFTILIFGVILGSRPGPGTFITAVALGPLINLFAVVLVPLHTGIIGIDAATGLVGVAVICAGVGLVICAEVGRGAMELFVDRAALHIRRRPPFVRTAVESSLLIAGIAMSGPTGPITVVVALVIGPGIAAAVHHFDRVLSAEVSVATIRRLRDLRLTRLH